MVLPMRGVCEGECLTTSEVKKRNMRSMMITNAPYTTFSIEAGGRTNITPVSRDKTGK